MEKAHSPNATWRIILWIFIPVYVIANVYLLYLGDFNGVILRFAEVLYVTLLIWLTRRVTEPLSTEHVEILENKSRLGAQIAVLISILLLTGLNSSTIPLWSEMVAWFQDLGEAVLPVEWFGGPGNSVANPMQYFVIPIILLLLLGAKPAELGFGRGNRVGQTCLLWLALPMVIWVGLLATGSLSAQTLARRIIGNTFQNGFFEEFLFRGALQTRLRRLLSMPVTLTIQALLFGLWHLRGNTQAMDGNFLAGLALCLVSQTVAGFAYGYVYERTRNLVAPSIAHVAMNALG